jgi:nucleotide-binding universal stress UspA family protein
MIMDSSKSEFRYTTTRTVISGKIRHLALIQRFSLPLSWRSMDREKAEYPARILRRKAMFKHILVPTDGSELSRATASRAVSFAKEAGARITVFFAKPEYPIAYFGEGALIDPTSPEKFSELADQQATEYLSEVQKQCVEAGVECSTIAVTSDVPYEAIVEAAEKSSCDLIFMASHGRRGLSGFLLGSETNKVLTHSKVPVLVYR